MGAIIQTVDDIAKCLIDNLGLVWRGWEGQDSEDDFHLIIPKYIRITTSGVFWVLKCHYGEKGFILVNSNANGIDKVHCDLTVKKDEDVIRFLTITLLDEGLMVSIMPVVRHGSKV